MVVSLLREMKDRAVPAHSKGNVIQDLEFSMRAKGGMSQEEETKLRVISSLPKMGFVVGSGLSSFLGWFSLGLGRKMVGLPPMHGPRRFFFSAGLAYFTGKAMYHSTVRACAAVILKSEDERMKMELVNIILAKHSDDELLVAAVKRHFFAEHLFDDLHQDKPLFRWHPRHSYVDSAFLERVKEIEASNSEDESKSNSRQTTKSFGDLMEDPFACVFGSPGGDTEIRHPSENTGTAVRKRSELRARRRSHRHHQHADKLAAV